MLMDEPFGAIDPITRERLQNEFLRLQAELKKTIVFVTHDIDEAIKMGDRIAILGERSVIRQIDTPERILAYPVDDFVDDFIGSGSTIKGLNFEQRPRPQARRLPHDPIGPVAPGRAEALNASNKRGCWSLDEQSRPMRWMPRTDLQQSSGSYQDEGSTGPRPARADDTLFDSLEQMLQSSVRVLLCRRPAADPSSASWR